MRIFLEIISLVHIEAEDDGPAIGPRRSGRRDEYPEPWLIAVLVGKPHIIRIRFFVDIGDRFQDAGIAGKDGIYLHIRAWISEDELGRSAAGHEIDSCEHYAIRTVDAIALYSSIVSGGIAF